MEKASI